MDNTTAATPKSQWKGSVLGLLAATLVMSFLSGTIIFLPWGICFYINYIVGHMSVSGRRLNFNGTGMGLLGTWIKWVFLTCITLGIYSFFIPNNLWKWITSHVTVD